MDLRVVGLEVTYLSPERLEPLGLDSLVGSVIDDLPDGRKALTGLPAFIASRGES